MEDLTHDLILSKLETKFPGAVSEIQFPYGLLTFQVSVENIVPIIQYLQNEKSLGFTYLTDLCGIHYPDKELGLGVIYHLHNLQENIRIRIKVDLPTSNPRIPTISHIFSGANWMERETYDFFGIIFENHPDLRRILNMDDMVAFPLRKEFPLEDPNRKDKNDEYFGR